MWTNSGLSARSSSGPSGVALLCGRVAGLSPRQRSLCRSSPDAMVAIGTGLRLALQECQHQFRHERWNCSSAPHAAAHATPLLVR
ncbi:wnt7, partial [Frankliniella occidentalis]